MKSEVRVKKTREQKDKFPCLKISRSGQTVVLFTGPDSGTVVDVGNAAFNEMAEYKPNWNRWAFDPLPKGSKVVLTA